MGFCILDQLKNRMSILIAEVLWRELPVLLFLPLSTPINLFTLLTIPQPDFLPHGLFPTFLPTFLLLFTHLLSSLIFISFTPLLYSSSFSFIISLLYSSSSSISILIYKFSYSSYPPITVIKSPIAMLITSTLSSS